MANVGSQAHRNLLPGSPKGWASTSSEAALGPSPSSQRCTLPTPPTGSSPLGGTHSLLIGPPSGNLTGATCVISI